MRHLNSVHLNGLRALECAGRHGSLAGAAGEFGVSVGAVSQQVIKAEAQIGRKVFERTPRGLVPTSFGRQFLATLERGFSTLDEAVALAARRPSNVLTISVAPVLASKWLVPRLAAYGRLHPDIQIRLDANSVLVDPDASDVDVGLRVGRGDWPGVKAEFLLEQQVFPVCAPELAKRLAEPRDLFDVPVVTDANSNLTWDMWLGGFGLSSNAMRTGNTFTDASLALDAAIAGQGVMLAWQTLAQYALSVGTLVAPFAERASTGHAYWFVTSASRREDRRITDFRHWVRAEMQATERMFG